MQALCQAYLGQTAAVQALVPLAQTMINLQTATNGELPLEVGRGKDSGIWYTYFALTPLAAAVRVIRNTTGTDLFRWTGSGGRSLSLALNYLFNWLKAPNGYTMPRVNDPWPGDLFEAMGAEYGNGAWSGYAKTAKTCWPIAYTGHHEAFNFSTLTSVAGQ